MFPHLENEEKLFHCYSGYFTDLTDSVFFKWFGAKANIWETSISKLGHNEQKGFVPQATTVIKTPALKSPWYKRWIYDTTFHGWKAHTSLVIYPSLLISYRLKAQLSFSWIVPRRRIERPITKSCSENKTNWELCKTDTFKYWLFVKQQSTWDKQMQSNSNIRHAH